MTAADFNELNVVDEMMAYLYNSGVDKVINITVNHNTYALMMTHTTPNHQSVYNSQTNEFFGAHVILDDEIPDNIIEFYTKSNNTMRLKFKGRE
jgi:hypothetical protein